MTPAYGRLLAEELGTWPAPAAAAVVGPDALLARAGSDRAYAWASVTKPLTALVTLAAVRQGSLSLDDAAGPPGSTVRHLLAHSSGLAAETDKVLAPPGRRRIYSNRGYELLGTLLEERTGRPFADQLHRVVLDPLSMRRTTFEGSPAHGASGPVEDLARLAAELLNPRRLPATLVAQLRTTAFPGLAGVLPGFGRQDPNDWGLGCEVRGHKEPHWTSPDASPESFGHFGQAGALLWVDPVARVALVAAGEAPFGSWAAEAWPRLSTRVLAATPQPPQREHEHGHENADAHEHAPTRETPG